jgi:hypothetical protein
MSNGMTSLEVLSDSSTSPLSSSLQQPQHEFQLNHPLALFHSSVRDEE